MSQVNLLQTLPVLFIIVFMKPKESNLFNDPKKLARAGLSVRMTALYLLGVINPWPFLYKVIPDDRPNRKDN